MTIPMWECSVEFYEGQRGKEGGVILTTLDGDKAKVPMHFLGLMWEHQAEDTWVFTNCGTTPISITRKDLDQLAMLLQEMEEGPDPQDGWLEE